jgi:hypothetical protein
MMIDDILKADENVYITKVIQEAIKEAVKEVVHAHPLSQDEIYWVRMAIKAEAERSQYRKAIIEKSLSGLVWVALVAAGGWFADFFIRHWK